MSLWLRCAQSHIWELISNNIWLLQAAGRLSSSLCKDFSIYIACWTRFFPLFETRCWKKAVQMWQEFKKKKKNRHWNRIIIRGLYVSQTDGRHHRGKGPHRREVSDSTPAQQWSIIHTHTRLAHIGAHKSKHKKTCNCQHTSSPTQPQSVKAKCTLWSKSFQNVWPHLTMFVSELSLLTEVRLLSEPLEGRRR